MAFHKDKTPEFFNKFSEGHFSGSLGVDITHVEEHKLEGRMKIQSDFFAPNGFIHAGSIVTFADTCAGYATVAHLPINGKSFTTLELKSNFITAAKEGYLEAVCEPEHIGRTTQVWRVVVKNSVTQKKIAIFSCTQLILY